MWVSRKCVNCSMMVSDDNPPEIFGNNHPLLDPLCITDRLLVGLVNASLNPPHNRHIRTFKNFLNSSCSAPLFLNPIPGCATQLLCWLHGLSVNLEIFGFFFKNTNPCYCFPPPPQGSGNRRQISVYHRGAKPVR